MSKLPKWFKGKIYKEGETITNPYSGVKSTLTAEELSMYDYIRGVQLFLDMGHKDKNIIKDFQKGINWLKENNLQAYNNLVE